MAVGLAEVAVVEAPVLVKVGLVGVAIHAGAWPDYDHTESTPTRELGPVSCALSEAIRALAYVIQLATGDRSVNLADDDGVHRGWTHTAEACALAGVLTWFTVSHISFLAPWSVEFGVVAFSAAFSHVVLGDMLTPGGVPLSLLWNLVTPGRLWRRHRVPLFTTNHPNEHLIFMCGVRMAIVVAALPALGLTLSPYTFVVAVFVGSAWHLAVVFGLIKRVRV
ncbi:metal-dependent hydrolase [Actinomycetospora sp. CA-053990]|uniref:metal-dependent hydrolase n=1 Tax=Actinomycetospora sp. CA-053990 TaxID=3239891 RepID=UPI003D8FFDB3